MIALSFAAPLVLGALVLLPALYYLLRITPPPPKSVIFPPAALFLQQDHSSSEASRTPWWMLLLRLVLLACVILAVAGPVWRPPVSTGGGPLLIVLDDTWPAAAQWAQRMAFARARLDAAAEAGRMAALALASRAGQDIQFQPAARILERLAAISPQPVLADHMALLPALVKAAEPDMTIEWLSDGLAQGQADAFAKALAALAPLHVAMATKPVLAIAGYESAAEDAHVRLVRSADRVAQTGVLRVLDGRGQTLAVRNFAFNSGMTLDVALNLPLDLRNQIDHFEIEDQASAGAVYLLDESQRRARIGLFAQMNADVTQQPLLSSLYYLKKALAPHADVFTPPEGAPDPISALLDSEPAELILADVGTFSAVQTEKLNRFIAGGGVLLRFAGSHLTGDRDPFLPVRLRRGERAFGSALSWDVPKKLKSFEAASPFSGLNVPEDVTVSRQVLAEPEAGLPAKVWASLDDGTPLVTAEARGKGLVVLFHINADTSWSNLALSGLFVEMLQRVAHAARMAGASGGPVKGVMPPRLTLDGFGHLAAPSPQAQSLPAGFSGTVSLEHLPGLYGEAGHDLALNTLAQVKALTALDVSPLAVEDIAEGGGQRLDLRPFLLGLALVLFLLDCALALRPQRWRALAVLVMLGLLPLFAGRTEAQQLSPRDIEATLNVHLGYILTGSRDVDEVSRQGLQSLSRQLARRTSVSPGEPVGLDPAQDVLDLYPLIYWPVVAEAELPSAQAVQHLATYMARGGTILFDTRDALVRRPDGAPTPGQLWLRRALHGLDMPELEPVPPDHVMTKSFYLLESFAGRTTMGETFVEALPPVNSTHPQPVRGGDSVSPVIITSNDLAAGWAVDELGRGLFPLIPGSARQRELALRGGINIVMYTLTGSYKADQVHMKALLERLRN